VSGATLITFLLSDANYDAEVKVLEETKDLGGKTLVCKAHHRSCAGCS
jgi:hypothetical protein